MTAPPSIDAPWKPETKEDMDWLIAQLRQWPTRVHPDRTTSCSFIMQSAANALASLAPAEDVERYREALREALRRYPDAVGVLTWFACASGLRAGDASDQAVAWADEIARSALEGGR
jgi:hypothetical protein